MGLELATIAAISAATTVASTVYSISQNQKAREAQERSRTEQAASNKAAQMEERRRQIREERIKRARIMQSAENTGTVGGSGEGGALSGMSTQLASNIGQNLGAVQRGMNMSIFAQDAADAQNNAQTAMLLGKLAPTALDLGNNIFAPKATAPTTGKMDWYE